MIPFVRDSKHIAICNFWVWRSLVACLNGVQEAESSSLSTQTKIFPRNSLEFRGFFYVRIRALPNSYPICAKAISRIVHEVNCLSPQSLSSDVMTVHSRCSSQENFCTQGKFFIEGKRDNDFIHLLP